MNSFREICNELFCSLQAVRECHCDERSDEAISLKSFMSQMDFKKNEPQPHLKKDSGNLFMGLWPI